LRRGAQKGKSHSKRPVSPNVPQWVKTSPEEIEKLIVDLAKRGLSKAAIGQVLRDENGIPLAKAVLGKTISQVLADNKVERRIPDDLQALIEHADKTVKHLEQHPVDHASLRGLEITESKIHRIAKYYRRKKILPADWKYKPRAAIFS
jgi:small subunit ribosomal protein S15